MTPPTPAPDAQLTVGELAERGGVSRRTVRYYVQRGLLAPPLGAGRGSRYTPAHLDRLIRIRTLQEANVPLAEIVARLEGPAPSRPAGRRPTPRPAPASWRRLTLADGVELHVRDGALGPVRLARLAALVDDALTPDMSDPPTPPHPTEETR